MQGKHPPLQKAWSLSKEGKTKTDVGGASSVSHRLWESWAILCIHKAWNTITSHFLFIVIIYQVLSISRVAWPLDISFIKSILCHLLRKSQTQAWHCHPAALEENTCHYILPAAPEVDEAAMCVYRILHLTLQIVWELPGLNLSPVSSFDPGSEAQLEGPVRHCRWGALGALRNSGYQRMTFPDRIPAGYLGGFSFSLAT